MPGEDLGGWVIERWTGRLARSLEAMTGERPRTARRPEPQAPPEDALWWEQSFSGLPGGCLFIGSPEHTWVETGRRVLRAAGVEEVDSAEARGAYLEVVAQACSELAGDLGASCAEGKESAGAPTGLAFWAVEIALAEGPPLRLWAAAKSLPGQPGSAAPRHNPNTLELLMEVELPVSISFGRAELPLKDVLKLTTGSIVELNRAISEPVEVIVNNCVVARGEVVVVDGNYGVRIQQIVSRSERLRTLK